MREVAVRLALETHGAQLCRHVALGGGNVQRSSLDVTHLGGHIEGQDTLDSQIVELEVQQGF